MKRAIQKILGELYVDLGHVLMLVPRAAVVHSPSFVKNDPKARLALKAAGRDASGCARPFAGRGRRQAPNGSAPAAGDDYGVELDRGSVKDDW